MDVVGSIPTATTSPAAGKAPYYGFQPPLNWDRWNEPMWVYVIASGKSRKPLKIGISRDVEKRILSLEAGNPHGLRCLHRTKVHRVIAPQIERRLHAMFAERALGREWFTVGLGEVKPPLSALVAAGKKAVERFRIESRNASYPTSTYHIRKAGKWAA